MTPRTLFLIQLIDKLGVPLMTALQNAPSEKDSAETLAGLLSSSVKLGLSMTGKMGLHEEDGDVDSVRVALTASAAQMIADSYVKTGNIPIDEDHDRMSKGVDALISFAENFTASRDHTERLKTFGSDKPLFDSAQSQIFYFSAMQPVLAAVAAFPFGQSETRLIQDIAEKLQARAASMREAVCGSGTDAAEDRFTELMILHALARVYAQAHERATAALEKTAGDEAGDTDAQPDIQTVWTAFDTQLAMLETLLNVALPGDAPETTNVAPEAVVPAAATIAQEDVPAPPARPEPPPQPPAAPAETPAAAPASSEAAPSNPMGFFAKKDEGAPGTATAEPAAPEPPPAPAAPPPPTAPAEQEAAATPDSSGEPGGGNPMSFFKPGAKSEDQ